jgi:hypothetical protein
MSIIRKEFNQILIKKEMLDGVTYKDKVIYIKKEDLINIVSDITSDRYSIISSAVICMQGQDLQLSHFLYWLAYDITYEMLQYPEMHKNIPLYVRESFDGKFTLYANRKMV